MNKKQLYVVPALEVSEFKVCNLILSSEPIVDPATSTGEKLDGGEVNTDKTADDHSSGFAKQMTTVFTTD